MKDWLTMHALSVVLKFALGPITYVLGRYLLNAWGWIDNLPPFAKRLAVFVLAVTISGILTALGIDVPAECAAVAAGQVSDACAQALVSNPVLSGILGAIVALFIHAKKKEPPHE